MMLSVLLGAVPEAVLVGDDVDVVWVTNDSRTAGPGTLFVALPGRRFEGRDFVATALDAGAVAVAFPAGSEPWPGVTNVFLPRGRPDLAPLAARIQGDPGRSLALVGVTGTNGKTTVVTLFADIVAAAGFPPGLVGTVEHRIGAEVRPAAYTTPEAPEVHRVLREMVDAGVRHAALEISSIGLVEHRVDGIELAAAAYLNLSPDHLDYHLDMADYGAAKRRLFDLRAAGGVAVVDVDDAFGRALAADLDGEVWRVSLRDADAEVHYTGLTADAEGVRGTLRTPRGPIELRSPLLGRYNASNLAAAAALARAVGLPAEAVTTALATATIRGRLQPVANDRGLTVVVDYAHSPDAIERVLETLRPLTRGRLWCLFGCGGDRDAAKRGPMGRAAAGADGVVVTNDNPRHEDPEQIAAAASAGAIDAGRPRADRPTAGGTWVELDRAAAIEALLAAAAPGDTVLLAGKGHESYQQVGDVKHPFDDVEVARDALAALGAGR